MKVTGGNQNNNYIERSYRKLERRQRVDKENGARERGCHGKVTEATAIDLTLDAGSRPIVNREAQPVTAQLHGLANSSKATSQSSR
ncbi:hypothetical protein V1281_006435 [Nitrobacteraceae bacterium AZCC 2161]